MVSTQTRIEELKGRYKGPVFIVGSGPSLESQVDLMDRLSKKKTFACNRINQWLPFIPTYYACNLNPVRAGQEPDRPRYRKHKFIVARSREFGYFDTSGWIEVPKGKATNLSGIHDIVPVLTGAGMAFILVQIAAWLGHDKIYLVGCDHKENGQVYDKEGFHGVAPNHRALWSLLKKTYTENGIEVRDCTPDGAINDILGYTDLEKLL